MSAADSFSEISRPRSQSQSSSDAFHDVGHSSGESTSNFSNIQSPQVPPSVFTLASESDDERILVPRSGWDSAQSRSTGGGSAVLLGSPWLASDGSSFDMLSSVGSQVDDDNFLSRGSDGGDVDDDEPGEEHARAHQRALRERPEDEDDDSSSSSASSAEDEVLYQGEDAPMAAAPITSTSLAQRLAGLMIHSPAVTATPIRESVTPIPTLIFPPAPSAATSKAERKKEKRKRQKERRKERKRAAKLQQAAPDEGSDEYQAAVAHVSNYLRDPPKKPSPLDRLRFYQAIIIELGLLEGGKTPLPVSCKAAKAILKAQAHLNVKEYLATRTKPSTAGSTPSTLLTTNTDGLTKNERRALRRKMNSSPTPGLGGAQDVGAGVTELRKIMYPSKSALVKSLKGNKKAVMPRGQIKTMGLNVLMVSLCS